MTIEEAVNELDELTMYVEHAFTEEHKCKSFEALQISIESLEKQKPKKIKRDYYCGFVSYECPNCERDVKNDASDIFNYCPFCGQAIKRK